MQTPATGSSCPAATHPRTGACPNTAEQFWPPFGLALRHGDLELRVVRDEDVLPLAAIALTMLPPEQWHYLHRLYAFVTDDLATTTRNLLAYHWAKRAETSPTRWSLQFAVFSAGQVVGLQTLDATDFGYMRHVSTGSYMDPGLRGQGLGTRARALVLELAFRHLGAVVATSSYATGNDGSAGVSAKLGYEPDGLDQRVFRGMVFDLHRLRLTRDRWSDCRPQWVGGAAVGGAPALRAMLAIPGPAEDAAGSRRPLGP